MEGPFTAPTAFRAIKKEDPARNIKKYDLSGFRYLFLAGERLDPDTYHWAHASSKTSNRSLVADRDRMADNREQHGDRGISYKARFFNKTGAGV